MSAFALMQINYANDLLSRILMLYKNTYPFEKAEIDFAKKYQIRIPVK